MSDSSPRILVVRAGAIGDTLMATPLIRALRRTFPDAYITFLASRTALPVVAHNPYLDETLSVAYRHLPLPLNPQLWRVVSRLKELHPDSALVLESHPDLIGLARRAHPARLLAFEAPQARRGGQPTQAMQKRDGIELVPFEPQLHSSENHLQIAKRIGARPDGLQMDLCYPEKLDEVVRERLSKAGVEVWRPLIGIHPGWGGRQRPTDLTLLRSWPASRFAEVARRLVNQEGAQIVLTGSADDRQLTRYIAEHSGVPCLDWAGELPLLELAALIRRLDVYVTVDSGPAHMAAALGTPLVTLWGPGIRHQTAPVAGSGSVRILDHYVHCAPCYGTPLMKTCRDNICMKQIEAEEVCSAVSDILGAAR